MSLVNGRQLSASRQTSARQISAHGGLFSHAEALTALSRAGVVEGS